MVLGSQPHPDQTAHTHALPNKPETLPCWVKGKRAGEAEQPRPALRCKIRTPSQLTPLQRSGKHALFWVESAPQTPCRILLGTEAGDSAVRPRGCGPALADTLWTQHFVKEKGNCAILEGIFQKEVTHPTPRSGGGGFLTQLQRRAAIRWAEPPADCCCAYHLRAAWHPAPTFLGKQPCPVRRFAVVAEFLPWEPSGMDFFFFYLVLR